MQERDVTEVTQDEIVAEEIVSETPARTYLNKQNRNTLAAFKRSREKVFHPYGSTYNAGKNQKKRDERNKISK